MHRPHFAYPAPPPGCHDEPYEYFYDSSVMQVQSVPALGYLYSLLFALDKDAEFRWRGFKVGIQDVSVPLEVQWKNAAGDVLSDVISNTAGDQATVNTVLYAVGSGYTPDFGGVAVPWDEEIVCPPGAVLESNWFNANAAAAINLPSSVTLLGVKRYYGGRKS